MFSRSSPLWLRWGRVVHRLVSGCCIMQEGSSRSRLPYVVDKASNRLRPLPSCANQVASLVGQVRFSHPTCRRGMHPGSRSPALAAVHGFRVVWRTCVIVSRVHILHIKKFHEMTVNGVRRRGSVDFGLKTMNTVWGDSASFVRKVLQSTPF